MKIRIKKWGDMFIVSIDGQTFYADIEMHPEPPPELIGAVGDDLAFALIDMARHHKLELEVKDGHAFPTA